MVEMDIAWKTLFGFLLNRPCSKCLRRNPERSANKINTLVLLFPTRRKSNMTFQPKPFTVRQGPLRSIMLVPVYSTPGRPLCKTPLLTSAMKCYSVMDANGSLYWDFLQSYVRLQIEADVRFIPTEERLAKSIAIMS